MLKYQPNIKFKYMVRKVSLLLIICLSGCTSAFSQDKKEKESVFHLSFVPPLSTNGFRAKEYTNVASLNILVGVSKNEKTLTVGGLANVIINNSKGLQIAGICNYIGNDGNGALFSGFINITRHNYNGLELAGLANIANNVEGVQIAGLVNVAKNVKGVQFAGLVNIAENSDYPVGFLNLIKNGKFGIATTYNELGSSILTFRSGSEITYGILGIGINHKTDKVSFVAEAGIGMRINCTSWLSMNNELKVESIGSFFTHRNFKTGYSFLPAFRISPHFEIFGGPSINYMQSTKMNYKQIFPSHSLWKNHADSKLQQVYIGYQFGIQYIIK